VHCISTDTGDDKIRPQRGDRRQIAAGSLRVAWSNWRPAGRIQSETTCNKAPAKLFVNLLLVTTGSFILFTLKDLKPFAIPISSAVLRTSATHSVGLKNLRK
jgi:hypothetical protein